MYRMRRLRAEDGMILPLAMIVLVGLLLLVALVVDSGITANQQATVQINRRAALSAADSGLQAGIYRLSAQPWANVLNNAYAIPPTHCFGTQDDGPPTQANGVCNGPEIAGNSNSGQDTVTDSNSTLGTYSYNITPELKQSSGPSCTGWWVNGGTSYGGVTQRCVTAWGTYNGVTRRVQERIAAEAWVFPINGILSMGEMNWDTSGSQTLNLPGTFESNGQMTIGSGSNQTIPDDLSQAVLKSPIKISFGAGNKCTGTCVYQDPTTTPPLTTPFARPPGPAASTYAAVANPLNNSDSSLPSTVYTSSTHIFNSNLGTAAKPGAGGHAGTQGKIGFTFNTGTYIFCNMTIGGEVATAVGSQVTIYIDSPGSGDGLCGSPANGGACKQSPGTLAMNGSGLYNPNPNPASLQIFIYGNAGCTTALTKGAPLGGEIKIDNSGNMLVDANGNLSASGTTALTNADLYAPDTYLTTTGVGIYWSGGIVVGGAESNDNDIWGFTQHPPTQQWFPTAWHECSTTPPDPTNPGSGCY